MDRSINRIASSALSLMLCFSMIFCMVFASADIVSAAGDQYSYIDENGQSKSVDIDPYYFVEGLSDLPGISMYNRAEGHVSWYVLNSDKTFKNRLNAFGEVHLILCDGATLTANQGINVPPGSSLQIYAQSEGSNMGRLVAAAGSHAAGIGGNEDNSNGPVTICGGDITATGGKYAAGIGGGDEGHGGGVTITGGKVTATGGECAAGIGGGDKCSAGNITITGGTVKAKSGAQGAGIGGGRYGNAGTISITGGDITSESSYGGAGIGSGRSNSGSDYAAPGEFKGGQINIGGSSRIHASAGRGIYELRPGEASGLVLVDADDGGAGIGSGRSGYGVLVDITGDSYVTATNSPGDYSKTTTKFSKNSACIGTGYEPKTAGAVLIKDTGGNLRIDAMMHFGTRERDTDYDAQAIGYGDDGDAGCHVDMEYEFAMVFTGRADSSDVSNPALKNERYDRIRQHYRDIELFYKTVRIASCKHPDQKYIPVTGKEDEYHYVNCEYCGGKWSTPHEEFWTEWEHDNTSHWRKCSVCGYTQKAAHNFDTSDRKCLCGVQGLRIDFNANGGTGSMEPVDFVESIKFTYPECGFVPPAGQAFIGWSINGDTSTDYLHAPGTYDYFSESRTMTAVYSASWSSLQEDINKAADGAVIKVMSHYYGSNTDSPLAIPSGKKITIDLNGFCLDKRSKMPNLGEAVRVNSGAELTITDSSADQKGRITGGATDQRGGGAVVDSNAKLFLESGSIYNNYAQNGGAGVLVNGGEFVMSGGSITGNMAQNAGSAVHIASGSFIMTGGSISGNSGLTKTAGAVTAESGGSFRVSGSPVIGGNICYEKAYEGGDDESNVYLDRPGLIKVTGALDSDAKISVTPAEAVAEGKTLKVTDGFSINEDGAESFLGAFTNFVSSGDYLFGLDDSGELIMGRDTAAVSFEAGDGSGSMDGLTALNNAGIILPACSFTAPEGKTFRQWRNGSEVYAAQGRAKVSGDTSFTAEWKDSEGHYNITVSAGEGGKAYAEKYSALENEVVGITAEPSDGYRFTQWSVTETGQSAGRHASVSDPSASSAKLTLGSLDVTVSAAFEPVRVSAVSLDNTELDMKIGQTEKLTASVVPYNALNKSVSWSVVPEGGSVVRVDSKGNVEAVGAGSAIVRATTADGGFTADCRVVVAPRHTVTFDTDGGSTVGQVTVDDGEKLARPADPTKRNYRFLGWKKKNGESVSADYYDFSSAVTGDMTLKAFWEHVHNRSTLTMVPSKAAKCEADGNDEYWKCEVCGIFFADENGKDEIAEDSWIIPAVGHSWGSWTPDGEENHKRICVHDGAHTERAAHRWDEGEITTAPTYDDDGVMTYTCIDCGKTKTTAIDKLDPEEISISVRRIGGGSVYASAPKGVRGDKISIRASAAEGFRFSRWEKSGASAKIDDVNSAETVLTINAAANQRGLPVRLTAVFDINISKTTAALSQTEFKYNGETQRPEVISIGEGETERAFSEDVFDLEWSDAGSKDVGSYYVTIKGKGDGSNGLPVGELRAEYSILRDGDISIPRGKTLTYNGSRQTGVEAGEYYDISGNTAKDAGEYEAVASLKDKNNHSWIDGTTEDKKIAYSILPVTVDAPEGKTLTFSGKRQTGVEDGENYDISGNTAKDAGEYEAVASLKDKKNYTWTDGTTEDKRISYSILPVTVDVPEGKTLVFNGREQTGVEAGRYYSISGNTAVYGGVHAALLSLRDKTNYRWSDGTAEDKKVSFTIGKSKSTLKVRGKTAKVRLKKLRKKSQKVKRSKAYVLVRAEGPVTYTKLAVCKKKFTKKQNKKYGKYIKINKKSGNITVKKKLKKGTYKVKLRVSAAGNNNFESASKTVVFKIKVK